jgi:hypothetical protein
MLSVALGKYYSTQAYSVRNLMAQNQPTKPMASDSIPTFREFQFRGQPEALVRLFTELPSYLPAEWQPDTASESAIQGMGDDTGDYRCYRFAGAAHLPAATLWLFVEKAQAKVVNIVSPSEFELGYERYNAILARFAAAVMKAISALHLAIAIIPWHEPTLEQVLTTEPARLFRSFARLANSTTGTQHPADAARWQEFLISVHQHHVTPDDELLRRWLRVECRWPEETIDQVLDEMHSSLELLHRYQQTLPATPYGQAA